MEVRDHEMKGGEAKRDLDRKERSYSAQLLLQSPQQFIPCSWESPLEQPFVSVQQKTQPNPQPMLLARQLVQ